MYSNCHRMDTFFDRMAQDLETYAAHAKRKTIEVEDAILLLRRYSLSNTFFLIEVMNNLTKDTK